jgi:ABC-type branched-subunit amino acid transport system permease subunit
MDAYLAVLVVGLASGAVYALTGAGLTLTYVTSGVFNIAHGATGALGAYAYYEFRARQGCPAWVSLLLVLGVVAPVFGLLLELLARRLAETTVAYKVVAVIGLQLGIVGLLIARYGATPLVFPGFLPTDGFPVAGIVVGYDQLATFLIALGSVAGLVLFFRFSALGTQMRAVVDNPDLLALAGTSTARVRRTAWVTGSVFAALSGILIAPTSGLDALFLSLLVLQAFGAAAVGLFRSLPLTLLGGLGIGVAQALVGKEVADYESLTGLPTAVPFLVLVVVLISVRTSRLGAAGADRRLPPPLDPVPRVAKLPILVVAAVGAVLVPDLVGARLPLYSSAAAFIVLFASLNLLVRTSGQISLCHAAFAALGGTTFHHLQQAGVPWLLALFGVGLVAVPAGFLVALPAIRLQGLYLALATLGFGVLVQQLLFTTNFMFGDLNNRAVARPSGFESDRSFYYVLLAAAAAALVLVAVISSSRLGRLLKAMSDSPTALATGGLSVSVTKVLVFCISAWMAAIAGALLGAQGLSTSSQAFFPITSLLWLSVLAISGRGTITAPVIAAAMLTLPYGYISDPEVTKYFLPGFGLVAIAAVLLTGRPVSASSGSEALGTSRETLRARGGPVRARTAAPALAREV